MRIKLLSLLLLLGSFSACNPVDKTGSTQGPTSGSKPGSRPSEYSQPPEQSQPTISPPVGTSALTKVLAHQEKRFKDLEAIMAKNAKYHLKFPGKSAQQHALGALIAKSAWQAHGAGDHQKMISYLSQGIEALEAKYPGRIHFGLIGDYRFTKPGEDCDSSKPNSQGVPGLQSDGTFMIHVWGANDGNFNHENNYPGSFGSGQASCFSHQRPGVFGISTMPDGEEKVLMAPDKLLNSY